LAEAEEWSARLAVLRLPFRRTLTVLVANPKGGSGKTLSTLLAAASFGSVRPNYILAWDNNETRGTLALRAESSGHDRTVADMLPHLDRYRSASASVAEISGYVRAQTAFFDVLASDAMAGRMEMVDGKAFSALRSVLGRMYRLIVVDTGNNVGAPNWRAAMADADVLVVPTTVQRDTADAGLWLLSHLREVGRGDLVANAVAVVSCAGRRTDRRLLAEIVEHYRRLVRAVVVIPFDPLIAAGGRITYEALEPATRRAWLQATGALAESLSSASSRPKPKEEVS
jgi:MinD-like ATPase involved in chromosome partitioning or flagellar assembly